jgi:uncharacterized DUF497 family protein
MMELSRIADSISPPSPAQYRDLVLNNVRKRVAAGCAMGETDDLEWDDDKEAKNVEKHGISLLIAVLEDANLLEGISRRTSAVEQRNLAIGMVAGRVLACVYTWRGSRRRVISLRPAHRSERRAYERATGGGAKGG